PILGLLVGPGRCECEEGGFMKRLVVDVGFGNRVSPRPEVEDLARMATVENEDLVACEALLLKRFAKPLNVDAAGLDNPVFPKLDVVWVEQSQVLPFLGRVLAVAVTGVIDQSAVGIRDAPLVTKVGIVELKANGLVGGLGPDQLLDLKPVVLREERRDGL